MISRISKMNAVDDILENLPIETKKELVDLFEKIHFTSSQKLEIVKDEADLHQWKEKPFVSLLSLDEVQSKDGRSGERYMKKLRDHMLTLRKEETDYSSFFPKRKQHPKTKATVDDSAILIGRCPCPVDGEKTRCCKLRTLDAVQQCSFGCAYCSVGAFYNKNEIRVVDNLSKRLDDIELDSDIWHIGTGQASDSLLWGDDFGTLSDLSDFANKHKDIIIELKSKSKRDVFDRKYPKNMVFTWSLNAPTIIEKEEHLTAKLEERLECAERARDNNNLVGFHIHPMVYFKGWQDEYREVVREIEKRFSPDDIMMISIGTLTFTKAVLKRLREEGEESRVLEMELTPAAGKFSYPLDIKKKMFSHVYSSFSKDFKDNIFFYMCMEDPSLWQPVLNRSYQSDKDFEEDMKRHYFAKINNKSYGQFKQNQ